MSTRQSTKGEGREKQYKLDAADATASRQLVARNKRHRVACAAAPSFTSAPCRCPCPVCLLFGGGTGTHIKSHFTAQLNRSGGAARFNHSQKESNKAAKEMSERKKAKEREMERGRVEGEGAKSDVHQRNSCLL